MIIKHDRCAALVSIAVHVSGTNPCTNTDKSLSEAIEVATCCRQKARFDLATALLDIVDTFPLGREEPIAAMVRDQRCKIASGDSTTIEVADIQIVLPDKAPLPPLLIRGWNFASSMARHAASGFQRCEQGEIDARLAICQACPELRADNHCGLCGCPCVESNQLLNKLALKTEKCPLGKW